MTIDFKGFLHLIILVALTCTVFILLNENNNLKESLKEKSLASGASRSCVIEKIEVSCQVDQVECLCLWDISAYRAAVYELPGREPQLLWEDELKKSTDERLRRKREKDKGK